MLLKERIDNTSYLSEVQKNVLDYMYEHPLEIKGMSLKELSSKTFTSPATLVRLAKNLNYAGFEELREDFLKEQEYLNQKIHSIDANIPFEPKDDYIKIANKLTILNKETVDDTLSLLNYKDLNMAVDILNKANQIHLTAISFPLIHGYDFQLKMRKLGKQVTIVDILGEQLYAEAIIHPNDCALLISYSGETPLIREMIPVYKRKNVPIIAITSIGDSTLRRNADVCLSITTREKQYSKIAGFSNGTSIQLLLDILYSCVFSKNYETNLKNKLELSERSEPGRFASYEVIKE